MLSVMVTLSRSSASPSKQAEHSMYREMTFTMLPGFSLLAGSEDMSVVPDVSSVTMTEGETSSTASAAPAQGTRIPQSIASTHSSSKHFLIIFVRII